MSLRQVLTVVILLTITARNLPAQAPSKQLIVTLGPDTIAEAIALGTRETKPTSTAGFYRMECLGTTFTTPWSRVVAASQDAARHYKPFTAADVTPEMIAPDVIVSAEPMGATGRVFSVETLIVTRRGSKDLKDIIEPVASEVVKRTFSNQLGASVEGAGVIARYPLSIVDDGNEVRTVEAKFHFESRCRFPTKNVR